MATLQVKNVPDDLYEKAKQRATSQGQTLSQLVLRMLERDLSFPTMREWLDRVNERESQATSRPTHEDVMRALDETRAESDGR